MNSTPTARPRNVLSLINAGCGNDLSVERYLREALRAAQGEVVQLGALLGLDVAGRTPRRSMI